MVEEFHFLVAVGHVAFFLWEELNSEGNIYMYSNQFNLKEGLNLD